jgi:peptidoglycan/xylan/chitin deacetylase (PgdA/CDA1 family)
VKTEPKISIPAQSPNGGGLPSVRRIPLKWYVVLTISALFALLYFVTAQPITSGTPAARNLYALTAALATDGTPAIDRYISSPNNTFLSAPEDARSLAYFNGHYYAVGEPGTALLMLPFYGLGRLFGEDGAAAFVLLGLCLSAAGVCVAFYALARRLGAGQSAAIFATILLGVGSTLWRQGQIFAPGVFTLLLFVLALYLALAPLPRDLEHEGGQLNLWRGLALGGLLGFAVTVDLPNVLWTPLFAGYLLVRRRLNVPSASGLALGWGAGIVPLAVYNTVAFGKPWVFGYGFLLDMPGARSLGSYFLGGFAPLNIWQAFFGAGRANLGLFVLLFGAWGLTVLYAQRGKRLETIFFLLLAAFSGFFGVLRTGVSGTARVDFVLSVLVIFSLGVAVWHGRFLFFTRYEQRYLPAVAAAGASLYYLISPPFFLRDATTFLYIVPFAAIIGVIIFFWRTMSFMSASWKIAILSFSILLVTLVLTVFHVFSIGKSYAFSTTQSNNLLAFHNIESRCLGLSQGSGNRLVPGWYLNDKPLTCLELQNAKADDQLISYKIPVQGGKAYELYVEAESYNRMTVQWLWLNDGHTPVEAFGGKFTEVSTIAFETSGPTRQYVDNRAAPPSAAYLQLSFTGDTTELKEISLIDTSVRVEPFKNYGRAALSFTFDWETAMGGLIHSKGGTPSQRDEGEYGRGISEENIQEALADAARRGKNMRDGADILLDMFTRNRISGTFYGNGYNLLDGNTERRIFMGDPVYKWAAPKNRWESDYWSKNKWFGLDPYGTYKTHPEWYFGDQTDRLRDAGQDIQSHSFGHIYMRGVSREELALDTEAFARYARQKGLPLVRHFAFPWTSSNSLTPDIYRVLGDNGFQSVTRLYYTDQYIRQNNGKIFFDNGKRTPENAIDYQDFAGPNNPYFYLSRVKGDPRLYIFHDYYMTPGDASETAAKQLMEELILRRGYGSVWAHPEEVIGNTEQWERVVQYAAQKRNAGLWVDNVANIIQHRQDVAQIGVQTKWRDRNKLTLTVTNHGRNLVEGTTLTLPAKIGRAEGALSFRDAQLVLPPLQPGRSTTIEIELGG